MPQVFRTAVNRPLLASQPRERVKGWAVNWWSQTDHPTYDGLEPVYFF